MNKLINSLFEKDLVVKVVSILTAILIWFVVLDSDNPFEERTIAVPLTSNVDVLQSNSFQIVGTPLPTSVDIKIKGRRQKILGVTANDFKVSIDLSEILESGTKRISINPPEYLGNQDILIVGMNPSSLSLNFERIIGKQYPVEVEFTGSLPAGYEIVNLKVEPNNAILEEKESSISKVRRVVAYVNLNEADNNKEIVMRGTVLDSEGKPIRQFDGKVPIIVSFNLAKKVPIVANTKGSPATDYYLKEIKYSMATARVIGNKSILDGIKSLNAEAIDITDRNESFVSPLAINLPKGATILGEDSDNLTAEIIIEKLISRSISLPTSMVSISYGNTAGIMNYKVVDDNIPITIKGKVDDVNNIKTSDIRLSIQVNNLEPGEHEVPLVVRVPNNVTVIGEYSVNVIVTSIPPESAINPGASGV